MKVWAVLVKALGSARMTNVFALTAGRTGSTTFIEACQHATNYTAAHESGKGIVLADRLRFPDQHIEADNRLTWFLGPLGERYPDAIYVHLVRDREAVARSWARPGLSRLWEVARIGGAFDAALAEYRTRHNATTATGSA